MSLTDHGDQRHPDVTKRILDWAERQRLARISGPSLLFPELSPDPAPAPATAPRKRLHIPDFEPVPVRQRGSFGCQTKTLVSDQANQTKNQGENPTPLVTNSISQQIFLNAVADGTNKSKVDLMRAIGEESRPYFRRLPELHCIELYPYSLRVHKERFQPTFYKSKKGCSKRGKIDGFSLKSKMRLKRLASESRDSLISMLTLTYHENVPEDGEVTKRHLNALLVFLRREFKDAGGLKYLWIHEFQRRGAPHFHIYLNHSPDKETQKKIAKQWTKLTREGDIEEDENGDVIGEGRAQYNLHCRKKAWIDWEMHNGSYLCKYLDKQHQKNIPDDYGWVGRWWGSSRNLMPLPWVLSKSDLRQLMCEHDLKGAGYRSKMNKLTKTLGDYLRAKQRKYRKGSKYALRHLKQLKYSRWIQDGVAAFWKIIENIIDDDGCTSCDELLTGKRYDYSRLHLFARPSLP